MFRILSCLIVLGALAARAAELPRTTIRRVADIQSVTHAEASGVGVPFELEGWIVMSGVTFAFEDDSGAYNFGSYLSDTNVPYATGDRVRIAGEIVHEHGGIYAHCRKLAVLGHREPAPAVRATIAELLSGKFNYRLVTVRGEVSDVYKDEIAPGWTYFSIAERGQTIYLPLRQNLCTCDNPESLIGQTIEATGLYVFGDNLGMRQNIGRMFQTDRPLKILPSQSKGLFDVPELENCRQLGPSDVAALGRRRVRGTVLAVWRGNCALLKANDGRLIRLNLVSAPPPRTGLAVEAVGVPGSDLYNVNLMRVRWRPTTGRPASPASPVDLAVRNLFIDDLGCHRINPEYHGRSIRFQGTVRGLPSGANTERQIVLESDGFLLPVDFSSCPEALETLSEGCRVEITGVCVVDIDNWQPSVVFPRIKEILVVLPAADNLKVLARPSWWTTGRLLAVIGALLAVLAGIVMWNFTLRTLAERRGRELNEETIARVTSDLKLYERTRLAVELHDSLAQSLTGVSLEIKTAGRLADARDGTGMREHLSTASQTLESCRAELRNCLWDLRHHALELDDMNDAIRQTLSPVLGAARLAVRFAVPRDRLTDNTAHTILRIIRELTVNAIRHGAATEIKVAGSVENGRLNVSVRDDGAGFDPSSAPGVEQGHFGIEGIRERISAFKGTLRIDSAPGHGTKAVVSLEIPHETQDESRNAT